MRNVRAIDRSRFENILCCVEQPGDLALEAAEQGMTLFSLETHGKPQWPRGIFRLVRLIRSQKIDLIHTSLFDADIIGGIAGKICGVPVVATLCSIGGEPERLLDNPGVNQFKLALTTRLWGLTLRTCHRNCIAISDAVRVSIIKTYGVPESRIAVIYRSLVPGWNDANLTEESAKLRHGFGLDDAGPVLLNVARLYPPKGQKYLIQAMPEIVRQFPRAHLLMAGDGPLRDSLTSLSRELGVDRHITFLGRRTDVRCLLELADIFVFPSLFEGLGGALVEASGAGKPCVASRVGPIPEVVEHERSGLLVPSQSPEALAQAICRLVNDPELAQAMGRRGKQIAAEKFSISRNIKQLEELYAQILDPQQIYSDAALTS
jgi:glycosyltransferase involved in cell wall biosynthesis